MQVLSSRGSETGRRLGPLHAVPRLATVAVLAVSALVGLAPGAVVAADITVTVNSTGDGADVDGGSGTCSTSGGDCTLRAAIQTASKHTTGRARIEFAIPGGPGIKTINVGSGLPTLNNGTAGITIDGFTQNGASVNTSATIDNAVRQIELVGRGPNGNGGISITGANNVVRGLIMNRFSVAIGIRGEGSNTPAGNNNVIVGNLIGLRPDGSLVSDFATVIGKPCISLLAGAGFNRIGTPARADRNTISGCYEKGIYLENPFTFGNKIQNNIIGMDPTGTQRRGNRIGIDINGVAQNTLVGGSIEGEGNLLSGNFVSAVEVSHNKGTTGNNIIGNRIGTDPTGNSFSAQTKTNDFAIRLEGKPKCEPTSCGNDAGVSVVTGNVIVNSGRGGILVDKGFHDSTIRGNLIGVTRTGTVVGNGEYGIRIVAGANKIIVRDNEISGGRYGVQVGPRSIDPATSVEYPTAFNTITQNRMRGISANGIDLFPYGGVTDATSPSVNVNEGIARPEIFSKGASLDVRTCAGCVVELFETTRAAGQNGLGEEYLRSATASSQGIATFGGGFPARVTATATTPAGSTSEFAVTVVASTPVAPPAPPTVSTVTPSSAARGSSLTLVVNGTGFQQVVRASIVGAADGVAITSVVPRSGTQIDIALSVAGGAGLGTRTILIQNGDGTNVPTTIDIVAGGPFANLTARAESPTERADRIGNRVSV